MRYTREDDIFRSREPLTEDYIPDSIIGREDERTKIKNCIEPIVMGGDPNNFFVYGGQGVGKTVCVNYELQELEKGAAQYHDINLEWFEINCNGISSSYQLGIKLANRFLPKEDELSYNGASNEDVQKTLFEQLNNFCTDDDSVQDYIIIVLDEVNHLGSKDDLLYHFSRAGTANNLEARFCVIGLSNKLHYHRELDDSTLSSLKPRDIFFDDYKKDEVKAILKDRVDMAFQRDTVTEPALEFAAALAARDSGDARSGIDLISEAGDIARKENASQVTEDHVQQAKEATEHREWVNTVRALRDQHKIIIASLVHAHINGEAPIGRTDLYEYYKEFAIEIMDDYKTSRWLHDELDNMGKLNIVDVMDRGMTHQYELAVNLDIAVKGLARASIETSPAIPSKVGEALVADGYDLAVDEDYLDPSVVQ